MPLTRSDSPGCPSPGSPPGSTSLVSASRREALVAFALWCAAAVYTVGYCALFGYGRPVDELTFVLGIPSWVFWGIVVPWTVCTLLSIGFAACYMRDEPLGEEAATNTAAMDSAAASERRESEQRDLGQRDA